MSSDRLCSVCGIATSHLLLGRREESDGLTRVFQVMKCAACGLETPEPVHSIRFELLGGYYDGTVVEGSACRGIDLMTDGGTLGKRFWWGRSIVGRKYEVVERIYQHGDLLIRARYGGSQPS